MPGRSKIDLGAGVVSGAPGRKTIHSIEWAAGSIGNDTLIGTRGDYFLRGFSGNDRVEARGGDDTLVGDSGPTLLTAERGPTGASSARPSRAAKQRNVAPCGTMGRAKQR
ncbi:MAG: hypothetical protein ACRDMY_02995 [Gaiellaceae bacterium]